MPNIEIKKNIKYRKTIISCGCIVYRIEDSWDDTSLLLIKQFSDAEVWGIPKGKINQNESFEECAVRETREETGITVRLEDRLNDLRLSLKNKEKIIISFLARQICNMIPSSDDPDSEVSDVAWFKISKLPPLQGYQQNLILTALSLLKKKYEK